MIVVSDTSALSCFAELGELELLHRLYGSVTITSTVLSECCHRSAPEGLRRFLSSPPPWLTVVANPQPELAETRFLDPGEASAITLAWQHRDSSLLIIDEKKGRHVSLDLGLRITGAAGVLTDAASEGLIDFETTFQRLARTRFRLKSSVIDVLRKRLDERRIR